MTTPNAIMRPYALSRIGPKWMEPLDGLGIDARSVENNITQ
jgi:hypothetical protein